MNQRMLLLAVLCLQTPGLARASTTRTTTLPAFEWGACRVEVAPDERIDCGVLKVPENRSRSGSREIRLPVMVFRSRAATPAPDPVVFMSGGPGNSTIVGRRSGKNVPYLDRRDFILLEQRGARLAEPALECPEINRLKGEIAAGRLRGEFAESALTRAAASCREVLVQSGVDLDGYTTAATADDLEDLRRLLGYQRWNLYGLSYSTRLMLTVVRRHPGGVRSVVLNSVLPPEVNFDEVAAVNLRRSLDLVFSGCAIDPQCAAAHPDLERKFLDLVAAADRRALPAALDREKTGGQPAEIRGSEVVAAVYNALHDPEAIAELPRLIDEAASGRYEGWTRLFEAGQGPSSFTWGLRLSVWCGEEMPFESAERVASQVSPALGLGGIDERAATPAICRAWNVAPAPPSENEPVASTVPVLIFAGEFDPDTPPEWGRRLLRLMPRARYVELRGLSHGAGFSACGKPITLAFLEDPDGPLPIDCALRLSGSLFSGR